MSKRSIILSILAGLILAAAMPKPGIWAAAWFGLVPLLLALRGSRPRDAAVYGLITGCAYYGIILFWLTIFGYLPWALVVLKETFWLMLFAVIASWLMPERIGWWGYLAVPAAWTAIQWARLLGPLGFTWGSLAHTQADNLPIIQMASTTGPWGIDFLICLFSLALMGTFLAAHERRRFRPAGVIALVIGAVWIGGFAALDSGDSGYRGTKIAIIQGNTPHEINAPPDYSVDSFRTYERLSRRAAEGKPDFIIWPETTIPEDIAPDTWGALISRLARETGTGYIVGGYDASGQSESYNAAHFYDRTGRKLGVYHKVHLVPYGEYVPLRERMPWLKRYGIRDVDVRPGKSHNLVETDIGKLGTIICFESLFPAVARQEVSRGAEALVIITNDAWFLQTQAARHHMMMAKLRAVENRRWVVRAAATGISAVIDPYGRPQGELPVFTQGILTGSIARLQSLTPYARFGDWFVFACLAILAGCLARCKGKHVAEG